MKKICFVVCVVVLFGLISFLAQAEIEPFIVTLSLDKETVAIGEPITATWTATGGEAPYSVYPYMCFWVVDSAGSPISTSATYTEISANKYSSSFTPTIGEFIYVTIEMHDSGGRRKSAYTDKIPITGSVQIEPFIVTLSLDKETVAIGEPITATWTVSGGEAPYSVYPYMTFWVVDSAGSPISTRATYSDISANKFSSSFTPTIGEFIYFTVDMHDSGGRSKSAYTRKIPIFIRKLVTNLAFNSNSCILNQGDSEVIFVVCSPEDATVSSLSWSSDNTAIATVDGIGLVKGISAGEAIITATTMDGSNLSAQCTVQVLPPILITSIQLPVAESLNVGGKVQLDSVISPENAGDKTLSWTTSDASIATVSNGLVTAIGYGTAAITATATGGAEATCMITVDPSVQELRAVAYGLGLSTTNTGRSIMFSGGAQYGKPPYSAKFTLLTNGTQLASETFTTNGVETLYYNLGSSVIDATITVVVDVTDASGHRASARTSVQLYVNGWNISITELENSPLIVKVTGITITPASAIVKVGGAQSLSATVVPDSASNKSLTWTSSATNIAAVNENGIVTAVAPGTATITATAQDGSEVFAECIIAVNQKAYDMSGVKWDYTAPSIYDGTVKTVALTGLPDGVTPIYSGNTATSAGDYTASVTFNYDAANYEQPVLADLLWTIGKANYDMSGVKWDYTAPSIYDGTVKTVALTGLPDGVTPVYSGKAATSAGDYTASVTFNYDAANYEQPVLADLLWTIGKANYDMSGVKWDYTAPSIYDGTVKTVAFTGLPAGVTVASYTGNTATEVGDYTASATLVYDAANYVQPVLEPLAWAIVAPFVSALPGDTNGDSSIDIMDLVTIIDYIVSGRDTVFIMNADANGDGTVDIMDLVWIIDMIVGGS